MNGRVSLTDIARSTGLSVSTVSKGLRKVGTIGLATQKKVEEAAMALGYYPNPLLASLASRKFRPEGNDGAPLGYLFCPLGTLEDGYSLYIAKFGQEHARKMGYRLEVFDVRAFKDGVEATRMLYARGMQGIILPHNFKTNTLPGMDWSRFSVVGIDESLADSQDSEQPLLYRAAVDHLALVLKAWSETWKRGYRRIGFGLFKLRPALMDDYARWAATQICLLRIPARLRVPTFLAKAQDDIEGLDLKKWAERHRPDAVIGFNSYFGTKLREQGFRIPQDIGFATLHREAESTLPSEITTDAGMKHVRRQSILSAIELLDQQIRHHRYGLAREPRTLMIQSEWVEGETLPPKTGAGK
jgi:LacI family transcriptional regulator